MPPPESDTSTRPAGSDFIRAMIAGDVAAGEHGGRVVTRFPPEPNGFLHIGHAKAIGLNFAVAQEFGGRCHLRFDDTNPVTEDESYVEAIQESIRWLGYDWGEHLYFASDYFGAMYDFAEQLIRSGHAYVDSASEEEIREARGTISERGRPTPYRDRSAEASLELFRRMRAGDFPDGAHVLRAKIDLASPNLLLRDPILYRIRHARHHRTGDAWCIYPLYDFAHTVEDALECVTHSLCSLEFETHRPLYDWVAERWLEHAPASVEARCRPEQTEFARGELDYVVTSKRKLLRLIEEGHVEGWDDPRLATLAGLRRRGVTPEAIRAFWEMVGVTKANTHIDIGKLEYAIRDDLNAQAPRVLAVLDPLKVTITNYPEGATEELEAPYFPPDVGKPGSRTVPFGRELWIERDDFAEEPPRGFRRLAPGREVRLKYAYWIRCDEVVKDPDGGEIIELRCSYDPETRGGASPPDGRKVKGTIHWVSAEHALPAEVRLYDRLFTVPEPDAGEADFTAYLNPEALVVLPDARVEPSVAGDPADTRYQFERLGYFWRDPVDSASDHLVFNRIVPLKDSWAGRVTEALEPTDAARGSKSEDAERAPRPAPAERPEWTPATPEIAAAYACYTAKMGLPEDDARVLAQDAATARFFDAALESDADPRALANWTINELPRVLDGRSVGELPFGGARLAELVALVEEGTVSATAAKEVLAELAERGGNPREIIQARGLMQLSDPDEIAALVERTLAGHPDKAAEYRAGRRGLLGFFVGQTLRASGGRADPEAVREMVAARLE